MELLAIDDDDAVDELLALVDEVYAPHASALGARARRRHAAARRQALRSQVEQLQATLDALRHSFGVQDAAVDMPRLWARVAMRQRRQRQEVTEENAQLKRVALEQQALARHVAAVLEEIQALVLREAPPSSAPVVIEPLPGSAAPPLLRRRLDALCEYVADCAGTPTRNYSREHEVMWNEKQTALKTVFRSMMQYPFKLSVVVDEMWRYMQEQLPARPVTQDEIYYSETTFEAYKPFGWMEASGPTVLRRTWMQDGGVLLVSFATLRAPENDSNNVMAGLEMYEKTWIRVARVDASNPKSLVVVEIVNDCDVFATKGPDIPDHGEDSCGQARLERFATFIGGIAASKPGDGRQQLENRLLDASVSRRCDGPQL